MKKLIVLFLLLILTAKTAQAQVRSHLYTHPKIPPRSVLDRLNLKLAWATRISLDGLRDRIVSVEILPSAERDEVLIESLSGRVELRDAETGDLKWRTTVGIPYLRTYPPVAFKQGIFIIRRNMLFGLNRKTGRHHLFTIDPASGLPTLGYQLLFAPSGRPVTDAEGEALFVAGDNRVTQYVIPPFDSNQVTLPSVNPASALPAKMKKSPYQPVVGKNIKFLDVHITQPLVLYLGRVGVIGDEGTFLSLDTIELKTRQGFKIGGPTSVGMGQYDDMVYIGSDDQIVYALDVVSARLEWRYMAGAPISRTPLPTKKDVFVTALNRGLARLDRDWGRLIWRNPEADRFLALNQKYVYATDKRGHLLVLDYIRGRTLARYDTSDYVVRVSNRWTDRIYLGAHDGTIICLRPRDNELPFRPTPLPGKEKEKEKKAGS